MSDHVQRVVSAIEEGIRGQRRGYLFLAVFAIVLGLIGILVLDGGDTGSRMARRAVVGAYILPVVGVLAAVWVSTRKYPVLGLVRDEPGKVVWWYVDNRGQNGVHLVVGDETGGKHEAPLTLEAPEVLRQHMPAWLPHATAGYDADLAARFDAEPATLRRG
jgi:hypothetical protein